MQLIFDGHNDVLLRLWEHAKKGADPVAEFVDGTDKGHIDAPRAKKGGLAGGFCAMFIPPNEDYPPREVDENGHYNIRMVGPLEQPAALNTALEMAAIAFRLERADALSICRTTADIRAAFDAGRFAAILHIEGCEPIAEDLSTLETLYAAGLRSLGPVWSRHNAFGHGVPFAYPSSPDTAPGLTDAGVELVKECDRFGIMIDLAHITEQGFWDVARVSTAPLVATHSNVHALTPISRNLTDRQLDAIRERKGIAGLNYATTMLRADGMENADTPLADMVRHIDYMVERMGIDCVALGSDFDGATIPSAIGDAAGSQALVEALRTAGYGEDDLAKLCRENWLRLLKTVWHEA
ncbi:dipeptidase [Shinella sp. CPCC 101442]|uniref:dipeptidase n=1 Tax=Shinella sp. CPCC 101442 TaxID=2932265 RepID=UPI00215326DF|nr:dipeptidase [Shinella sp. CPCC 101442]MCR6499917.1 dipeptidase [Shinella sp. CPCC 101442]